MSAWTTYHVPDSPIILVLMNDQPMLHADGTPLVFYREIDAQRFIADQSKPLFDPQAAEVIADSFINLKDRGGR